MAALPAQGGGRGSLSGPRRLMRPSREGFVSTASSPQGRQLLLKTAVSEEGV